MSSRTQLIMQLAGNITYNDSDSDGDTETRSETSEQEPSKRDSSAAQIDIGPSPPRKPFLGPAEENLSIPSTSNSTSKNDSQMLCALPVNHVPMMVTPFESDNMPIEIFNENVIVPLEPEIFGDPTYEIFNITQAPIKSPIFSNTPSVLPVNPDRLMVTPVKRDKTCIDIPFEYMINPLEPMIFAGPSDENYNITTQTSPQAQSSAHNMLTVPLVNPEPTMITPVKYDMDFSDNGSSDNYSPSNSSDGDSSDFSDSPMKSQRKKTKKVNSENKGDEGENHEDTYEAETETEHRRDIIENVKRKVFELPGKTFRKRDEKHEHGEDNEDTAAAAKETEHRRNTLAERVKRKVFELPEKTSRKRERHEHEWKRKKAAICREKGESYMSQKGKLIPSKKIELGSLCQRERCRWKCDSKFDEEARTNIFKKFYSLNVNSKNALLFRSILIQPVARHRTNTQKNKSFSFKYRLTFNKEERFVCKSAFLALYQISAKKIQLIQNKLKSGSSAPTPDKRGVHHNRPHKHPEEVVNFIIAHIKQFPSEHSHYSRNKNINKLYLSPLLSIQKMYNLYIESCREAQLPTKYFVKQCSYRTVFSKHFNLSFGQPKSDTCCKCDAGLNNEEHKENYKFAFEQQKRDRLNAELNDNTVYITMDLQQTMPLPKLTTSKSFYLRQLWFYNFSVHAVNKLGTKPFFFTWTEDVSTKGSLEVGSCLHTFLQLFNTPPNNVEHLIIWSDSCAGQNKNFNIIALYQYFILKGYCKTVDHKFPEVGHSYMDSDRDFGRIEKVLRKHANIYTPHEYRNVLKSASVKNAVVFDMVDHFKNIDEISEKMHLVNRKKNTLNHQVLFRDGIKWIRVNEYGRYLYKTTLDENTPFLEVDILKQRCQKIQAEDFTLDIIKDKSNKISTEKISNLKEQLIYVHEEFRYFYQKIIGNDEDIPKQKKIVSLKRKT